MKFPFKKTTALFLTAGIMACAPQGDQQRALQQKAQQTAQPLANVETGMDVFEVFNDHSSRLVMRMSGTRTTVDIPDSIFSDGVHCVAAVTFLGNPNDMDAAVLSDRSDIVRLSCANGVCGVIDPKGPCATRKPGGPTP